METPYTAQEIKTISEQSTEASPQTTLIKVSDQLYGPKDSIAIRADNVSFWQNLRDDSEVVQAIKSKKQ